MTQNDGISALEAPTPTAPLRAPSTFWTWKLRLGHPFLVLLYGAVGGAAVTYAAAVAGAAHAAGH